MRFMVFSREGGETAPVSHEPRPLLPARRAITHARGSAPQRWSDRGEAEGNPDPGRIEEGKPLRRPALVLPRSVLIPMNSSRKARRLIPALGVALLAVVLLAPAAKAADIPSLITTAQYKALVGFV